MEKENEIFNLIADDIVEETFPYIWNQEMSYIEETRKEELVAEMFPVGVAQALVLMMQMEEIMGGCVR